MYWLTVTFYFKQILTSLLADCSRPNEVARCRHCMGWDLRSKSFCCQRVEIPETYPTEYDANFPKIPMDRGMQLKFLPLVKLSFEFLTKVVNLATHTIWCWKWSKRIRTAYLRTCKVATFVFTHLLIFCRQNNNNLDSNNNEDEVNKDNDGNIEANYTPLIATPSSVLSKLGDSVRLVDT